MKKESKILAIAMIIIGLILFLISASFTGGAGGATTLIMVIGGIIILVRSKKPLISFYDDYFETPTLKRFYIDVVKISTKKKIISLEFEDGKKHTINLSAFDKKQAQEISARLNNIVSNQSKIK